MSSAAAADIADDEPEGDRDAEAAASRAAGAAGSDDDDDGGGPVDREAPDRATADAGAASSRCGGPRARMTAIRWRRSQRAT